MASEARITSGLFISKGQLKYQSNPQTFSADVSTARGPTPGVIRIATTGTPIILSQLDRPGLCRMMNLDPTNFVTVGVYDGYSFFPVIELLPGETYPMRLSRYLNEEFTTGAATGTGTDVNQLWAVADSDEVDLLVEAFET